MNNKRSVFSLCVCFSTALAQEQMDHSQMQGMDENRASAFLMNQASGTSMNPVLADANDHDKLWFMEHDVHGECIHCGHATIRATRSRQVLLPELVHGFRRAQPRE